MKNKKTILTIAIVALIAIGGFVGIKYFQQSNTPTITVGVDPKNDTEKAANEKIAEEFYNATGIQIEWVEYQDVSTELTADIAAGTEPMVFPAGGEVIESYINEGYIQPLSDTVTPAVEETIPSIMEAFTVDGVVYGVPADFAVGVTYYNADMLAEMGFTPEDIPTDMADVEAFLTEVKAKCPEGTVPLVIEPWLGNMFFYVEALGGQMYDPETGYATFDNPQTRQVIETLLDWHEKGLLALDSELGQGSAADAFINEQAVFFTNGSWNGATIEDQSDINFGVAQVPTVNGQSVTKIHTTGWVTSANNTPEEQAAAEEFINWVGTEPGATMYCEAKGSLTANMESAKVIEYPEYYSEYFEAANAEVAPIHAWGPYSSIINNAFNNVYLSILIGELPIDALTQAQNDANAEIDNIKDADAQQ